jgi:hypothetical protein
MKIYRESTGALPAYAWPGGYPFYYLDAHNDVLCPACANAQDNDDTAPAIVFSEVHWEGPPLHCDECSGTIESAYGDPDE